MDTSIGVMLASIVASLLYSIFKPSGWSRERKEGVAALTALAVGIGYAVVVGRDQPMDFAQLIALAFATQQAFYRLLAEKLGVEKATRMVRTRLGVGH
jgi:hypothetical protein